MTDDLDHSIRVAAFDWLRRRVEIHGELLSRDVLSHGFDFQGERIPLVSPQGIFKPRLLDYPLSITTTTGGPYDDSIAADDILRYRYRGTDPSHRDNLGLKRAMLDRRPLIYFLGVVRGKYLPAWPVYIVGADDSALTFTVAIDNQFEMVAAVDAVHEDRTAIRRYVTGTVRHRLHQLGFRERVLRAYRNQCTICTLKHPELLDAAHIIPDSDPKGLPVVTNGLSLCKLHHAAFDRYVIGVTPDYKVHVRADILEEIDGPMLQHGIKEMHGRKIELPRSEADWPDQDHLDVRYQMFRKAG